jgi:hypothetical protein
MALAAEERLGSSLSEGLVVTHAPPAAASRSRVLLAGHPMPDGRGIAAALEVESLVRGLGRGDLLLVLLSGGASALIPAPCPGISLADKALTTSLLLRAGAPIQELNTVRKHLSRLKGGGLARIAAPARVLALALSDVVGDDLSTIASGPTVPDPTTFADALEVLQRRGLLDDTPLPVRRHLEAGAQGRTRFAPRLPRVAPGRRRDSHVPPALLPWRSDGGSGGLAAEVVLRQVLVVRPAQQRHVPHRVVATHSERAPMVILEAAAFRTTPTLTVDECAPAAIALVNRSPHRGRNVA